MDRYLSIQAFVKVAEKESFAEAARQLGVARSVVTERAHERAGGSRSGRP